VAGANAGAGGAASAGSGGSAGQSQPPGEGDGGEAGAGAPLSECPCAAPTPTCEAGKCVARGPSMIKAATFFVDATEVSVEQYAAFVRARGDDTSGQIAECAWNHSFEAAEPSDTPTLPVTGVDFCDATAFCAWADKQLCGKIGGGKLLFQELADPTKSQWFSACAGPKGEPYPYGSMHQPGACNDTSGATKLAPVGSFTSCDGHYDGIRDMVGNVSEWVNACDATAGAVDGCETIGGSYANGTTCSSSSLKHRDEQLPTVGFRCCSQ
jgi:formylglycine-generating enzyme